jgi:Holliday junction resolvasome RuvABC endonuclease subunit
MSTFMGVDPGVNGAVAVIGQDARVLELDRTPTFKPKKDSQRKEYLLGAMYELLLKREVTLCIIETVHAMPTNGSIGNFVLGRGSGLWEMALLVAKIPVIKVAPPTWKKHYGLLGQKKEGSILKAQQLFPTHSFKKSEDGLAEALLLANYGRTVAFPKTFGESVQLKGSDIDWNLDNLKAVFGVQK